MKISDSKSRYRAFTLVELLVVIAIIAVLVAISVPAVFSFRNAADKAIAISNMRQLQTANVSYASDHYSTFVSPMEGGLVEWWKNPEFVSQLKSAEATYGSGGVPNVDLPLSLMDPPIAKKRAPGYDELAGSYAYNTQGMTGSGYKLSLVADPGRTMAFITADFPAAGEVNEGNSVANIAYRHDKKAIAVYYDGHAAPITQTEVSGVPGGATGGFWDANPDA